MSKYFNDKPNTKPKADLTPLYNFIKGKMDFIGFLKETSNKNKKEK